MASALNTVLSTRLSNASWPISNPLKTPRLASPRPVSLARRRLVVRATETDTNEVKAKVPDKAPAGGGGGGGSSINQILGIKGAKQETDKWKIRVQLTKPVTWPPLVWGVVCGAAASGNFHWSLEDIAKSIICMLMSGPCLTGYTQTLNDWYDREIDAINEPYRPIPSGAISENEVITQIWVLLLGGLSLAGLLDVWAGHDFPVIFYLAVGGSLLSYIYSAPPLKLKQNGWIGNFALGASYISLPWWAGQALFGTLTPDIIVLTLLYSMAGLGIAIVNDFKSVEGDRALGLQSLPVAFGTETAKWICVGAIDITQISVAGYLLGSGKPYYALALLGLIVPQVFFQFKYFLKDPVKYDVKYQQLVADVVAALNSDTGRKGKEQKERYHLRTSALAVKGYARFPPAVTWFFFLVHKRPKKRRKTTEHLYNSRTRLYCLCPGSCLALGYRCFFFSRIFLRLILNRVML